MYSKKQSCILHLGTPKTGTTALQFGLADYDDGETVYGKIPTAPDNPNHSESLAFAGLTAGDVQERVDSYPNWLADANKMMASNSAVMIYMLREGIPPDPAVYQRALAANISKVPHRRVIFSGELLFFNYNSAKGLISLLKRDFERIEGVCYLRSCAGAFLSRFQQRLTNPSPAAFFSDGMRQYLNYLTFKDADCLAHWKEALKDEGLQTAIYARSELENGDIIDDFCQRFDLDASRARRNRTNVSFSAEATAALAALSFYGEMPKQHTHFVRNKRYLDVLMYEFGRGKLGLSEAFTERLHGANKEALDWIDREVGQDFVRSYSKGSHTIDKHEDLLDICHDILPELIDYLAAKAGRKFGKLPKNVEGFAKALSRLLSSREPFPSRRLPTNFDAGQYLTLNPDIARAGIKPEQHFLSHGCFEGRFF